MPKGREIININVDRVSLVNKAANRRKWIMLKAQKQEGKMDLKELVKMGLLTEQDAEFLMKSEKSESLKDSDIVSKVKDLMKSLTASVVEQKKEGAELKDDIVKSVKQQITDAVASLHKEEEDAKAANEKAEADKKAADEKATSDKEQADKDAEVKENLEKMTARIEGLKKAENIDEIMKIVKEIRGESGTADLKVVETLTKKIEALEADILDMRKSSDQIKDKQLKSAGGHFSWGNIFK